LFAIGTYSFKATYIFLTVYTYFVAFFILISIAVYAAEISKMNFVSDYTYGFAFTFSNIGMLAAIKCGVAMIVEILKK
jgi:hypothetical protein